MTSPSTPPTITPITQPTAAIPRVSSGRRQHGDDQRRRGHHRSSTGRAAPPCPRRAASRGRSCAAGSGIRPGVALDGADRHTVGRSEELVLTSPRSPRRATTPSTPHQERPRELIRRSYWPCSTSGLGRSHARAPQAATVSPYTRRVSSPCCRAAGSPRTGAVELLERLELLDVLFGGAQHAEPIDDLVGHEVGVRIFRLPVAGCSRTRVLL